MFGFIFKSSIYFCLSFLILAFPINRKTIFSRLNDYSAPLTKQLYSKLSIQLMDIVDQSAQGFKKLFSNSRPNWKPQSPMIEEDTLHSQIAAPKRKKRQKNKSRPETVSDDYTETDKRRLLELLD